MNIVKNKNLPYKNFIYLIEEWEINWWTEKFNVSKKELEEAVKEVGNSTEEVMKYLSMKF